MIVLLGMTFLEKGFSLCFEYLYIVLTFAIFAVIKTVLNKKQANLKKRGLSERVYMVKRNNELVERKISDLVQSDLLCLSNGDVAPAEIEVLDENGQLEAVIPEGTVITGDSIIGRIKNTKGYKFVKAHNRRSTSKTCINRIRRMIMYHTLLVPYYIFVHKLTLQTIPNYIKIFVVIVTLAMRDYLKTYFKALTTTAEEKLLDKDAVVQDDAVIDELGFVDVVDMDLDGCLASASGEPAKIATISGEQINLFDLNDGKITSMGLEVDVSSRLALEKWEKGMIVDLEEVIDRINQFVDDESGRETVVFNKEMKSKIEQLMNMWTKEYRVCAAIQDNGDSVQLIAILGFYSPLRDNAYSAVEDMTRAGIKVVLSSSAPSDNLIAYAEKLRVPVAGIVLGSDWRRMNNNEKISIVKSRNLFAKFTSQDRLELLCIQKTLKQKVAFVSDSIDEIDAMKLADVGVCMQTSCQGLHSTASLVLKNNNVTALPEAVFMSRGAMKSYYNLMNYIIATVCTISISYAVMHFDHGYVLNRAHILVLGLFTPLHALLIATNVTPRTARKNPTAALVRNFIIYIVIPFIGYSFSPATMTIRLIMESGDLQADKHKLLEMQNDRIATLWLVGLITAYNLFMLLQRSNKWTWATAAATIGSVLLITKVAAFRTLVGLGDIRISEWLFAMTAVIPVCIIYKIMAVFN